MNRALFSGVSGLRSFQTWLETIANNVANVNTPGFKTSRPEFGDILSQLIRAGTDPDSGGNSEPAQIGLGTRIIGMTTNFSQGSLLNTGRLGDVAVQGEGFFVVKQADTTFYSRAGSFRFNANGNLCDPTGALVQGWMADDNGNVETGGAVTNLRVDPNTAVAARATSEVRLGGRLPAGIAVGESVTSQSTVFDALGTAHQIKFEWTKTGANAWTQAAYDTATDPATALTPASTAMTFSPSTGALLTPAAAVAYTFTPTTGAAAQTITVGFGTAAGGNPLTQFDGPMTAAVVEKDGSVAGTLRALAISDNGDIMATFSNGDITVVGRIATASFANPGGLEKMGDNHWRATPGSGDALVGAPGTATRGSLVSGALEGSNVDLSQEFTNLIIAQRGFQANTRVVATSDEMLQELIQIKR